ncbi:hypothetical protein, partial [Xanthomonas pisi]|uniref:hypothetical protein n=1 Tax=Xanthomonas pisi TaxID=56457 RepID=UPI001B80D356
MSEDALPHPWCGSEGSSPRRAWRAIPHRPADLLQTRTRDSTAAHCAAFFRRFRKLRYADSAIPPDRARLRSNTPRSRRKGRSTL